MDGGMGSNSDTQRTLQPRARVRMRVRVCVRESTDLCVRFVRCYNELDILGTQTLRTHHNREGTTMWCNASSPPPQLYLTSSNSWACSAVIVTAWAKNCTTHPHTYTHTHSKTTTPPSVCVYVCVANALVD